MSAGPHLEFIEPVIEAFAFLTDRGFRAAVDPPDLVRFERGAVEVTVYHDSRSAEIDVEIRIGGDAYSMSELIRAADAVKAREYRSWCATSAEGMEAGARSLAGLLARFGETALAEDPAFLAALKNQRIEWSKEQASGTTMARDRVAAGLAFRDGRYDEAARLLGQMESVLTPAERIKLRISRRRAALGDGTGTPSVPLGERWAAVLLKEPETGMGYQVATITLHDGRWFDDVTIVDGAATGLPPQVAEWLTDSDIASITVTHGRRPRG